MTAASGRKVWSPESTTKRDRRKMRLSATAGVARSLPPFSATWQPPPRQPPVSLPRISFSSRLSRLGRCCKGSPPVSWRRKEARGQEDGEVDVFGISH